MKRILCFGDSNTYGYDPRSFLGDRYPADVRWTGRLKAAGYNVINEGQNGRAIPWQAPALPECDLFIVMLGGNDLLMGASAVQAADRMEGFLAAFPRPVLLIAPPPMQPGSWVTEARLIPDSVELAGYYRALAERLGIYFADAGDWGVELAHDGVHFSPDGHAAFAARLLKTLNSIGF